VIYNQELPFLAAGDTNLPKEFAVRRVPFPVESALSGSYHLQATLGEKTPLL